MRTPQPTPVFDTYWRFAAKRQEVFFARIERGGPGPWTDDPILLKHKFTNAYRAADRVSQYLIRNVIYQGSQEPEEVFFRTILFKIFNKIETWEMLIDELGQVTWSEYDRARLGRELANAMRAAPIFSAAYIMPTGHRAYGSQPSKHEYFLSMIEHMMAERLPLRLAQQPSLDRVFQALSAFPMMGDFLAFQFTIDLNYGPLVDFNEDDFVVAGPGALSGISKCFSDSAGMSPAEIIRWTTERQEVEFERLGLTFRSLWGRRLHLIDCQNLFCEVNKYARVAHGDVVGADGRTQIKQIFRPTARPLAYWFPPKWGINHLVPASAGGTAAEAQQRRPVQGMLL